MNKLKNFFEKYGLEILLSVILPILFWSQFLKNSLRFLRSDFDVFVTYLFANKISFLYYHEFPYFSSYIGGGFFVWSNPQTIFFSVPQLISLIFNNQWLAIRISICALSSISMLGMFQLLKQLEITNIWCRLFGAIVYTFSGFIVSHFIMGHISFHNIIYIPWLAAAFIWSYRNDKFSYSIPILIALMVYAGQNVPSIFIIFILLSFLTFTKLKRFIGYLILGVLLSLPKIVGAYQLLSWFPRKVEMGYISHFWIQTFNIFIRALMWPNQVWANFKVDNTLSPWELNGYVGILVLIFTVIFLIYYKRFLKQKKFILSMLLLIIVSVFLYPGDLNPAWKYLSKNIIFGSLHIPSRFIGLMALPLACFASFGLSQIENKLKKYNNLILIGLCVLVFWDYFRINQPYFDHVQNNCTIDNTTYFKKENPFKHVKGPDWSLFGSTIFESDYMFTYLQNNTGILQFYEALLGYDTYVFLRRSLVREGDLSLYVKDPNISVKLVSPSKIRVEITKVKNEVIEIPININYFPGWQITDKKEGMTLNKEWSPSKWGLLTLRLDEKFPLNIKEEIILKYSPSLIVKISFILMISTLILLIYFKVRNK